jgi:hypothetical protein
MSKQAIVIDTQVIAKPDTNNRPQIPSPLASAKTIFPTNVGNGEYNDDDETTD